MDRDLSYLADIRNACRQIFDLTRDVPEHDFFADTGKSLAVLHQLIGMGEAAKRLSSTLRQESGHIPWKQITGTRDKLVHEYDTVDHTIIWEIVQQDLPAVLASSEALIDQKARESK